MSVAEAQQRISSAEASRWMLYLREHPTLDDVLAAYLAQLTAVLATINRDTKKKPEGFSITDFLIEFAPTPAPQQSTAEQRLALQLMADTDAE
jgi:hypothetical protein